MTKQGITCRLCGGDSWWVFSKQLLGKYTVGFYRCDTCQSLQSEEPYWLAESYTEKSLIPDIRVLQRVMAMRMLVYYLSKALRVSDADSILDWGGGNGLLVRLLRDLGLDAYRFDTYVNNLYALGYDRTEGRYYRLITAFQVLEHFSAPAQDLDQIFKLEPEYLLISTGLYNNQNQDWEYLNAYGRHIFCYSNKARELIAHKYGYFKIGIGDITLYSKNRLSKITRIKIRAIFSSRFATLLNTLLVLLPKNEALANRDRAEAYKMFYEKGEVGKVNGP